MLDSYLPVGFLFAGWIIYTTNNFEVPAIHKVNHVNLQ